MKENSFALSLAPSVKGNYLHEIRECVKKEKPEQPYSNRCKRLFPAATREGPGKTQTSVSGNRALDETKGMTDRVTSLPAFASRRKNNMESPSGERRRESPLTAMTSERRSLIKKLTKNYRKKEKSQDVAVRETEDKAERSSVPIQHGPLPQPNNENEEMPEQPYFLGGDLEGPIDGPFDSKGRLYRTIGYPGGLLPSPRSKEGQVRS